MIDEGPVQTAQVTWENLGFEEFGLQLICMLTEQIKSTTESEVPVQPLLQSEIQVQESMSDLTDRSEVSQSGLTRSVSEPILNPSMCTFESPLDSEELEKDEPPGILLFCPLSPPENVQWRTEFT